MLTSILKVVLTTIVFIGCSRGQNASLRLYSGHESEINEIPYIVSIMFGSIHVCGGSIINEDLIITAAHCVANRNDLEVFAGMVELSDPGKYFQVSNVKEVFIHPLFDYRKKSINNNVALVLLETKFVLNEHVAVIEIIDQHELREVINRRETAIISGWGFNENSVLSNSLFSGMVKLLSDQECSRRQEREECGVYQPGLHLCSKIENPLKGAGLMDDGGPLVVRNKLAGIILHGKNVRDPRCPDRSSIYANVQHYMDFITSHFTNKTVIDEDCSSSSPSSSSSTSGNVILFEFEFLIDVQINNDFYEDESTPVAVYSVKDYNYWFFGTRHAEDRVEEYGYMKEESDNKNFIINVLLVKSLIHPKYGVSFKVHSDCFITPYITLRRIN